MAPPPPAPAPPPLPRPDRNDPGAELRILPWYVHTIAVSVLLVAGTAFGKYLARRGVRDIDLAIGEGTSRPKLHVFVEHLFVGSHYYKVAYLLALLPLVALIFRRQWLASGLTTLNTLVLAAGLCVVPVTFWGSMAGLNDAMYDRIYESGDYPELKPRAESEREYYERTGQDPELKIEF